jgi:hypothetical protein
MPRSTQPMPAHFRPLAFACATAALLTGIQPAHAALLEGDDATAFPTANGDPTGFWGWAFGAENSASPSFLTTPATPTPTAEPPRGPNEIRAKTPLLSDPLNPDAPSFDSATPEQPADDQTAAQEAGAAAQPRPLPIAVGEPRSLLMRQLGTTPLQRYFELDAEYRVRSVSVNPLDLASEKVRNVWWTEQRLRMNMAMKVEKVASINMQMDVLRGVLFGDNGPFTGRPTTAENPSANQGVRVAANQPNNTGWNVGLDPQYAETSEQSLQFSSYIPVLQGIDPIAVNRVFGDVYTPIGLLRIGRQPLSYGDNLLGHDGSRINRWGVSNNQDTADRILFGTKLDELVNFIAKGSAHKPDLSQDNGVILALFYDWRSQGYIYDSRQKLHQYGFQVQWKIRETDWGGVRIRNWNLSAGLAHLSQQQFDTSIFGVPIRFDASINDFSISAQYLLITGATREISDGFARLSNDPNRKATRQDIQGHGAELILDYRIGPVVLTAQADYASGDDNPRPDNPITSFAFARDKNVGILLFKQVLPYASARSVAVGIQKLRDLDAPSFPITEVATQGRFTNAIAAFPQVKWEFYRNLRHKLHLRTGALFAWSAATGGSVDPIRTTLADNNGNIADVAVNFNGGKPARYYGTEIDGQIEWNFLDTFLLTFETAYFITGPALKDRNGDGVNSFLFEARAHFLF